MLRAAIVGLGDWSDVIAQAVQDKSEAIRLVTCCSRSPDKRAAFAVEYDTAQHEAYEAVLGNADIEVVILTTPHSLHAEQVIEAAAAGKNVFCEKPFTLTAAACAEAAVVLAVGQNRRFSGAAREVKQRFDAGEFGTVLHFEANLSYPGQKIYKPGIWRSEALENSDGAMTSCGIHMIDTATWPLGQIARVSARRARRRGGACNRAWA